MKVDARHRRAALERDGQRCGVVAADSLLCDDENGQHSREKASGFENEAPFKSIVRVVWLAVAAAKDGQRAKENNARAT